MGCVDAGGGGGGLSLVGACLARSRGESFGCRLSEKWSQQVPSFNILMRCSVTRWIDYLFNIRPLKTRKCSPMA